MDIREKVVGLKKLWEKVANTEDLIGLQDNMCSIVAEEKSASGTKVDPDSCKWVNYIAELEGTSEWLDTLMVDHNFGLDGCLEVCPAGKKEIL